MLTNSLQNAYLDDLCKSQAIVSIYLINGIKLSGIISSFDDNVILLKDQKSTMDQLLYKHAISTVVPVINKNIDRSSYVYEQVIYEQGLR